MATIPISRIEVAKTISGNSPFTLRFPVGASQTFKKGDVLSINASGHAVIGTATTTPGPVKILGIAAQDAVSATAGSTYVLVWIACDDTIFRANVSEATSQDMIGKSYGIILSLTAGATDKWVVDNTAAPLGATKKLIVLNLDPRDTVADTNGRVEFVFHGNASALTYTS